MSSKPLYICTYTIPLVEIGERGDKRVSSCEEHALDDLRGNVFVVLLGNSEKEYRRGGGYFVELCETSLRKKKDPSSFFERLRSRRNILTQTETETETETERTGEALSSKLQLWIATLTTMVVRL